jgi:hypothetical protein
MAKAKNSEEEQKEVGQAQVDQMFTKTTDHAPDKPVRLDHNVEGGASFGAPPAQGVNLSKEEEEFAANLAKSSEKNAQPEKTPASKEVK